MALVKKSKLTADVPPPAKPVRRRRAAPRRATAQQKARPASARPQDKVSERLAAATEELASGLTEASAAAEELRRAMEQIASGASEAAGASQEQLAAIKQVVTNLGVARSQAEASRRRTEAVEVVLAETAVQIGTSVRAIERNGARQGASVQVDRRARAPRPGHRRDHPGGQPHLRPDQSPRPECGDRGGARRRPWPRLRRRGRRGARACRDLGEERAGGPEARRGDPGRRARGRRAPCSRRPRRRSANRRPAPPWSTSLDGLREDMQKIADGSQETLTAALEADRAASEAEKGAMLVASAAEEQSRRAERGPGGGRRAGQVARAGPDARRRSWRGPRKPRAPARWTLLPPSRSAPPPRSCRPPSRSCRAPRARSWRRSARSTAAPSSRPPPRSRPRRPWRRSRRAPSWRSRTRRRRNERIAKMAADLKQSSGAVEKLVGGVSTEPRRRRAAAWRRSRRLEAVGRNIEKIVNAHLAGRGPDQHAGGQRRGRGGARRRSRAAASRSCRTTSAASRARPPKAPTGSRRRSAASSSRSPRCAATSSRSSIPSRSRSRTTASVHRRASRRSSARPRRCASANDAILQGADADPGGRRRDRRPARARSRPRPRRRAPPPARPRRRRPSRRSGAEDLAAAIEEIASLADALKQQNG